VILIWFLPWRFQTNDDELMMWLVSGAYTGTPESYAVFIHPLLSWLFSKLYTFFPAIPWYPLTWFGVMYLSYVVFLRLVWERKSVSLVNQIWCLFLFAFLIHFSFFLQFSIVSAFAASAGLVARTLKSKGSKFQLRFYWTDLLLVIAFLIRHEVPFLILAGLIVLNLIINQRRILFASVIPIFFLVFSFSFTQFWIRELGHSDFQELNKLRSSIFDDPVLQLMKEGFKDENPALYYFANGLIDYHNDDLTIEKLSMWKKRLNQDRLTLYQPKWLYQSLWVYLEHQWFFIGFVITFLIFSISLFGQRIVFMVFILLFITLILSPFNLLNVRLYAIIFLAGFSSSFLLIDQLYIRNLKIFYSIILCLILGLIIHFKAFFDSKSNLPPSGTLIESLYELKQNGFEIIYLIGSDEIFREFRFVKTVPFRLLGWSTFLEEKDITAKVSKTAYLVDDWVFYSNLGYFERYPESKILLDGFILVTLK